MWRRLPASMAHDMWRSSPPNLANLPDLPASHLFSLSCFVLPPLLLSPNFEFLELFLGKFDNPCELLFF